MSSITIYHNPVAPDWKPNRLMAAATASSKKLEAPINAEGQAMLCCSPALRLSQ